MGHPAARWVENRWSLRWSLPDGRWYDSEVIPHPTCSLTVELGSHPRAGMPPGETVVVTGVCTRRFDVEVRGWGRVVGLRLRPGGLAALTGHPASAWTDRSVAASEVLPPALAAALADPDLAAAGAAWSEVGGTRPGRSGRTSGPTRATTCCSTSSPTCSPTTPCSRSPTSPTGTPSPCAPCSASSRTTSASVRSGCSRATGCTTPSPTSTPGWAGTLTDLAVRYGWYDQAHFTRDFTALVGVTPGQYRDRGTTADAGHPASAAG